MILTGNEIKEQIRLGKIEISPFTSDYVGPNSVDLRLADEMLVYDLGGTGILDTHKECLTLDMGKCPDGSFLLMPNRLYLARTVERIRSDYYVPIVEGRSSLGRYGIQVNMSAGVCDLGFDGTLTLELTVVHPVKIYPNQRICQLLWVKTEGVRSMYAGRYQGQERATSSRMSWDSNDIKPPKPALARIDSSQVIDSVKSLPIGKIPNCS